MTLTICIVSFRRPAGLRRLLAGLEELDLDDDASLDVRVLVVDNDPSGSARATVDGHPGRRFPIDHVVEEVPGIPAARNRALEETSDRDLIAFVDDDEVPEPGWLQALLDVRTAAGVDLVTGPVVPVLPHGAPEWAAGVGFYGSLRYPTGTQVWFAGTGNLLCDRRALEAAGVRFNEAFSFTGGSDTFFSIQARGAGLRMAWADDAVVREWIGEERLSVRWIRRRAFRYGNVLVKCERLAGVGGRGLTRRFLSAFLRLARGFISVVTGLLTFERARLMTGVWNLAEAVGIFAGFLGLSASDYERPVSSA